MTNSWKKRLAYLAVGTVTVAGMTGAFGTAAFAAPDDDRTAPIGDFSAFAQEKLAESDQVAAIMPAGDGKVVAYIATKDGQAEDATVEALRNSSNVEIRTIEGGFEAYAETDVVGGAGYAAVTNPAGNTVGLCSVGFSGWSAEGAPAVISAGHCTDDNTRVDSALTLPTGDPAGGGATDNSDIELTRPLGELAFSQWGGPGNSNGTAGDPTSVDISVIDVTNEELTTLPEVTDWTTAASEDLSTSTVPVRSVGSATVGATVAKSGRTTGFTEGTVLETNGYANVGGRIVYGFSAELLSAQGDSGGAMIQGNTAVGVLSGGGTDDLGREITIGADLQAGLALAGGYSVALYLDAPVVTSVADGGQVYSGSTISGTGPAGATLEVSQSFGNAGDSFEVAIDGNGNWSFPAANRLGEVNYSLTATRGFDTSETTSFAVQVVLGAPAITSPFDGQIVETDIPVISGTGYPGATVTLTGDVTGEAVVADSGLWSIETGGLTYGSYSVSATQVVEGQPASPAAASTFQVVPVAPIITSPVSGTTYESGAAPTQLTGTGIAGATVVAYVNGNSAGSAVVAENGTWAIPFAAALAEGKYEISAAQVINGVGGTVATVNIAVAGAGGSVPTGNGPGLANTGNPAMPLVGGGALALLLAAGGVLLMVRRNQTATADRRS
ncbi:hypothetical protein N1028_13210 [Herbiconiux sp. CPCC 203407]|uniref:Uncharacterized protein n=1 Tax=Herbiconiux oxytropis TaxID=2970915 RepID=A0AA41XEQ7_9MICO|nr:Ig-like domain-containing protein [Herbiconiux oxytropis]MCS5723079.1 hypothetical protein [Herbiconiux oxytropis]MCS5726852.1 hypothetical protein [Herbiconiux oxytropis]